MTFDLPDTSNGTGEGMVPYPAPLAPAAPGPSPADEGSPLDDWQKAHATLMVRERAFADALARHAQGQASLHELELACDQFKAARELTDSLRQKALDLLLQERKPQLPPLGKGVPDCG